MSGLASLLDIEEQTISRWSKDKANNGNRPKYNAIVTLLRNGATNKTLFGVDSNPHGEMSELPSVEELVKNPMFQAELLKALKKLKEEGH